MPAWVSCNFAEPVKFGSFADAQKVQRDERCSCGAHFMVDFGQGRSYVVKCPKCGPVYEHMRVRAAAAERTASDRAFAGMDLKLVR